jgi:hypothetical protein
MSSVAPHRGEPTACQVVVGLLVPRPCGEDKAATCGQCSRSYCGDHGKGGTCRHCERHETAPAVLLEVPADLAFTPAELAAFEVERSDDPRDAWSDLT